MPETQFLLQFCEKKFLLFPETLSGPGRSLTRCSERFTRQNEERKSHDED